MGALQMTAHNDECRNMFEKWCKEEGYDSEELPIDEYGNTARNIWQAAYNAKRDDCEELVGVLSGAYGALCHVRHVSSPDWILIDAEIKVIREALAQYSGGKGEKYEIS